MKTIVIVLLMLAGIPAMAAKVNFNVGDVELVIEATNFEVGTIQPFLQCHFSDGSGIIESFPKKDLVYKVTALGGPVGGTSKFYKVNITNGRLKDFKLLASLKSCRYNLMVSSVDKLYGNILLAGSAFNMTTGELNSLLNDKELNEKISQANSPLRLIKKATFLTNLDN